MQRIGHEATTALIKNSPSAIARPTPIRIMMTANFTIFALYHLSSGPTKVRLSKDFSLQPASGPQALLSYHFFHKNLVPLAFNTAVLLTVGSSLCIANGNARFLRLVALGGVTSSLFAAMSIHGDATATQAGGLGLSATMITYAAFADAGRLAPLRLHPALWAPLFLSYAFYCNDKSVLGGALAGYFAFLAAL
jgi:membrane associated rhomboid family serine protease